MYSVLAKSEGAKKSKVAAGKTLSALATENGLADWQTIALFNWGTVEPDEVNRLLFEYIGWEQKDADPGKTVLKPHANADREILLPAPWKHDGTLALDKLHTIRIRKQPDPPVAIAIDALSRWFVPGKESCDLNYSLEGLAKNAEKVQLEVYGSNYCSAGDWNDGFVKFAAAADLTDTKLYENAEQAAAPERGKGVAITQWKGKVTAAAGALGKKYPGGEDRVVNAAFSPYTAVLRYHKDDGDKSARLDLDAFWPEFDAAGSATADSLKIRFAIRGTDRIASTQGGGTLLVVDGAGDVIYREPISLAHLGKRDAGFHEVAWNGTYSPHTKSNSAGGTKVIRADLPYRVQVQVHTGPNEANGLALAAMPTEVRLYVHSQTHAPTLNPYAADTDKPSFTLRCHRDLLTVTENLARGAGAPWIRLQLARAGFHPGPIETPVAAAYRSALFEFKRSVPQRKAKASDSFSRFTVDASEGADVLDAVEDFTAAPVRHRPWFGNPADGSDYAFDDAALGTRLNDPGQEVIVWVDDRHYYTDATWLNGAGVKGTQTRTKLIGDPAAMGNYALAYTGGDAVIDGKATWIPRPWIPLSVTPVLLSKAQNLGDALGAVSEDDRKWMAKAIGPLRVDWSFDEIDADPVVEVIVDQAMYDNRVSRPKLSLEHARNTNKAAAYARKDVVKNCVYSNAPATCGGVRPAASADYYKAVYGQQAESLKPWRAEPDPAVETIVTIVHDNTGQADDKTFAKRLGAAGVYFRPSTIAGDGMRLRAQMRFKPVGDYQLPNLAVLEKRYPLLPQAQSARVRVWRKASIRGFVSWGPNSSWGAHSAGLFRHFRAAYLHFVFEQADPAVASPVTAYFGDNNAFKDLIREAVVTTGAASAADKERAKKGNISLHPQRLWPWYNAPQFGVFEASAPNVNKATAVQKFYDTFCDYFYSLTNLYGLEWVKAIESRTGKLRGHVVVEFQAGDDFFVQEYECQGCTVKFWYVEKDAAGDSKLKAKCPANCGGKLKRRAPATTGHYTCTNGHAGAWGEAAVGGSFQGLLCTQTGCGGTLNADQVPRIPYACKKCGWTFDFSDPTGTTHVGATCFAGTCDGKLHRPGGDAGLFTEVYACNKCNADVTRNETTAGGGAHVGVTHQGCPKLISGKLARKAPVVVTPIPLGNRVEVSKAAKSGYTGIPVPSLGNPLGVSLNSKADTELWAHELAHNRYMEHAANAGGANNAQHDHANNTHFNFAGINETVATVQMWDRSCLMTYVTHLTTYDPVRDRRIMCGKCFLKVRGWKLAPITDPASGLHE